MATLTHRDVPDFSDGRSYETHPIGFIRTQWGWVVECGRCHQIMRRIDDPSHRQRVGSHTIANSLSHSTNEWDRERERGTICNRCMHGYSIECHKEDKRQRKLESKYGRFLVELWEKRGYDDCYRHWTPMSYVPSDVIKEWGGSIPVYLSLIHI